MLCHFFCFRLFQRRAPCNIVGPHHRHRHCCPITGSFGHLGLDSLTDDLSPHVARAACHSSTFVDVSWTRCRVGGGDGAWTFSRRICYAFYRASGRLHLPLCLSPSSLRPLVHPFLSLYLAFAFFVLPSLCFSSAGPPCTISLHLTLIYPSTCLPRRCTPSLPSVNPARTIRVHPYNFLYPHLPCASSVSSHAFSLFIPRFHGTTQRSAHDEQRGPSVTFLKLVVSRANSRARYFHRISGSDHWSPIFVGYARRDRHVKSTRITIASRLLFCSPTLLPSSRRSPPTTSLSPSSPLLCFSFVLYRFLFHRVFCLILSDY